MERRRILLDDEQLSLPLAHPPLQRRRLALDAVEVVTLRVTNEVARAANANPDGAAAFVAQEAGEMLSDTVTDWSRNRPPSSGYWDLKQRSAAAPDTHNWWYSARLNAWHRGVPQKDSSLARFVPHGTLMQAYEWRGLKKPSPGGYDYDLEQTPFAMPIAGELLSPAATVLVNDAIGRSEMTPPTVADRNPARRKVRL